MGRRVGVCWHAGRLYVPKQNVPAMEQTPCFGGGPESIYKSREVGMHHLVLTKALPAIQSLPQSSAGARAMMDTREFAIFPDGVLLPQRSVAQANSKGRHESEHQATRGTDRFIFFGLGAPIANLRRSHIAQYVEMAIDSCNGRQLPSRTLGRLAERDRVPATPGDLQHDGVETRRCVTFGSVQAWESFWRRFAA